MGVASADDLSGVPLFEQLDADARAAIAPWFELRDVSPDVKLVGEGAPGYSFFVLRDRHCNGEHQRRGGWEARFGRRSTDRGALERGRHGRSEQRRTAKRVASSPRSDDDDTRERRDPAAHGPPRSRCRRLLRDSERPQTIELGRRDRHPAHGRHGRAAVRLGLYRLAVRDTAAPARTLTAAMLTPTAFPELNDLLTRFAEETRRILGANLVGV